MLSKEELKRYNRHIILPEFGTTSQEKLKNAKVLVIGAGGLGCPVLQYLAAAGVGTLGIVDFDHIEESNLQRQVLFGTQDVGKFKAEVAAEKLSLQNPFINFNIHRLRLDSNNAIEIFTFYDIIIDGSDNFPTRYLVSDACTILRKPLIFGSIYKFEGQVSVFNYSTTEQLGPTYRCLFPDPPAPDSVPNCSTIGVLGVLPGIIGTFQANEAIKVITGIGKPLIGKLMVFDALTMESNLIHFDVNEENWKISSLEDDYELICEPLEIPDEQTFKELSAFELKAKMQQGEKIFLLDVREPYEYQISHLPNSVLIPMNNIPAQISKIPRDIPVIIYCHHGLRSAAILKYLQTEHQFTNLYNLSSGIDQWAHRIDKGMARY